MLQILKVTALLHTTVWSVYVISMKCNMQCITQCKVKIWWIEIAPPRLTFHCITGMGGVVGSKAKNKRIWCQKIELHRNVGLIEAFWSCKKIFSGLLLVVSKRKLWYKKTLTSFIWDIKYHFQKEELRRKNWQGRIDKKELTGENWRLGDK